MKRSVYNFDVVHPTLVGALAAALVVIVVGCHSIRQAAAVAAPAPQNVFWSRIESLCGRAFAGRLTEGSPTDSIFRRAALTMHVRSCTPTEIRIPFHADADRSRTWVLTRTTQGLRLKHDHRHADGTEDAITQYGGDTRNSGSAAQQEFYADVHTASLIPAARTNVWTVEIAPAERFVYALRRVGTDRRFRVEFDLEKPVAPPPPPWGTVQSSAIRSIDEAQRQDFDWGTLYTYFQDESYGTRDGLTAVAVIKPGREIHPPHQHAEEEYLMVVEGHGVWHLNGRERPAKPGDMQYAAPWDVHGIKNTGPVPLRFVVWKWNSKGVVPLSPPQ